MPATGDEDFVSIREELTISSKDTKCYTLEIVDDEEVEGNETVLIGLWDFQSSGIYYDLIDVVIIDDDGKS